MAEVWMERVRTNPEVLEKVEAFHNKCKEIKDEILSFSEENASSFFEEIPQKLSWNIKNDVKEGSYLEWVLAGGMYASD